MSQKVEISYRTIVFTALIILGLWFLWSIWDIVLQLLIAVIITAALNPLVNRLEITKLGSMKINRPLAILLVYMLLFTVIGFFVTAIAQPFVIQTSNLIKQMPTILERIAGWGINQDTIEQQIGQLNTLPADIFRLISSIFTNIIGVFTTMVMSFYLLLERKKLHKHLAALLGNSNLEIRTEKFLDHLEVNLGGWVRAELLLMAIVGIFTYLGLLLLRMPFALPLALIAGFLELFPNVGPTLAAIPAVIVGLTLSPLVAVGVAALYLMIQLLENNFIVPQLMSKVVGVNPLVTIVVLLIGFNLAGIRGAVLAVPMVLLSRAVIVYFFADKLNGFGK